MPPHEQNGDTPENVAIMGTQSVEFFPSVELQKVCVHQET